jgi:hypothetical protein
MTSSATPTITALGVIPVAGRDRLLINLWGGQGPFLTPKIFIIK